ncbi:MAG: class I SAM-dependent methyltransferase [bacterium]|nr:class I SAM-dependent methyltransferase [bacterium]
MALAARSNLLDAVVFQSKGMADFYKYEGRLATAPIIDFLVRYGERATGLLLDVGCGRRPYVNMFPNVRRYFGVDLTAMGANLLGNGQQLPIQSGSVDAVLSNQVIEHTPEPDELVNEMHRILTNGGLLFLTAPQMCRLHGEPHDYFRFTKWGLRHLLEKHGFEIETLEPQGGGMRALGAHLVSFAFTRWGGGARRRRLLRLGLINGVNRLARTMDRIIRWDKDTLGYNVLAKKVRP